jgi:molybdopterin-containing oxidoreductase family iron-sulfur binding subunit
MPKYHRRDFLKIVGASAGAAAAAGCSDPVQKLIPYVVQPEEITPGIPVYYASTCQECPTACGVHVRTREGRPVKLEGNPEHPVNRGSLCSRGQASIGRTYHPDRYRQPMVRGEDGALEPISWEDAIARLAGALREGGSRSWLLGGEIGPTASLWLDRVVETLGLGGRVVYEPFAPEALREASRVLFGAPAEPIFDLSESDFILDLGSDFLEAGPSPVEHGRQLAAARDADREETRGTHLVSIGPRLSMTVSNADEWIAAAPGSEGAVAAALAGLVDGDPAVMALLPSVSVAEAAEAAGIDAADLERIGSALSKAKNPVVLPPGPGLSSRRARDAAGAVLLLNAALGAVGRTLRFPGEASAGRRAHYQDALELIDAMDEGQIDVLLVHDANPVYSVPTSAGFAKALDNVGFVVSFASMPDETSERAHLILPDHTSLESWGDAESRPGVRSLVQPSIRPLYETRALVDTLLDAARNIGAEVPGDSFRVLLKTTWGAGAAFRSALGRGGDFGDFPAGPVAPLNDARAVEVKAPVLEGDGEFTLLAHPSPSFYDGRGANLPWLQELGDPVTKIAWQSWAEISPATAERLGGLSYGDILSVTTDVGSVEVPVVPRGGVRDDVIAIAIGQGHSVGSYARGQGVNVFSLLPRGTDESGGPAWLVAKAGASATGGHQRLAFLQGRQNQRGRMLGMAVSLADLANGHAKVEDYNEHATPAVGAADAEQGSAMEARAEEHGEGHAEHHLKPFVAEMDSSQDSAYRWGMAIDLDRCTGCNACITACYIENNIPVVGEESTLRGRSMAWLRIERWVGDGDNQGGTTLPIIPEEKSGPVDIRNGVMLCQQCGAAPCEPVCPVFATYHSDEGLNAMIYNRCIGTRYCSNNCPYKVRRYNWYDFALENLPDPMQLMSNPDVTVRGQGVMEKCTFCVHRIASSRQTAKDEGRSIADGEVTPACAQTCPSQAITFGNLKDAESVATKRGSDKIRGYHALHDLNTRPAVTDLAKVTRGPVEG